MTRVSFKLTYKIFLKIKSGKMNFIQTFRQNLDFTRDISYIPDISYILYLFYSTYIEHKLSIPSRQDWTHYNSDEISMITSFPITYLPFFTQRTHFTTLAGFTNPSRTIPGAIRIFILQLVGLCMHAYIM